MVRWEKRLFLLIQKKSVYSIVDPLMSIFFQVKGVLLKSGRVLEADVVIVGIGILLFVF